MNDKKRLKKEILSYFKLHKFKLFILYLVTILGDLIALIPLYLFGKALDFVIANNFMYVIKMVAIMAIVFFITIALSIIETNLDKYLNQAIVMDIQKKIYDKILKLRIEDFNLIKNGELLSKIGNDPQAIADFITNDILKIIISTATLVVVILFILNLSVELSIIAILTFPMSMILTAVLGKKTRKYIKKSKELNDDSFSIIQETIMGLIEIKSLNLQKYLSKKYKLNLKDLMENVLKTTKLSTNINALSSTISSMGEWLIILASSWLIINNRLTIGALASFNSFFSKFAESISSLAQINVKIQTVYLSINRIEGLMQLLDETRLKNDYKPNIYGDICIKEVNFSYVDSKKVLNNLSLEIEPKKLYVVVGENGCGKSTLLNLLMRFYEADSGEILLSNSDIKSIDIQYLREKVVYVPQQVAFFQGSIIDNLSLYNEKINLEEIMDVCKMVGIHNFIETLTEKYNTSIGKGGVNLSGGQLQKLAIVRAILRNPEIMILDEITSDLDSKSEFEIMQLLNELSEKFTIITVAHRINSILACPNIIVMSNGTIISQGKHDELISNCNIYIELYNNQLKNIKS